MQEEFFEGLAAEAADVSQVPTERNSARLRTMAERVVSLAADIADLEEQLRTRNTELWELKTKDMPSLMTECGVDRFGLAAAGVDLVLGPHVHANISSEWPEEQQVAGFEEIDRLGGGDIVRDVVSFSFGRGQHEQREEFKERVRGLNLSFGPPEMVEKRSVPWNTLTAWVRETIARVLPAGTPGLDLQKVGASVGLMVNIKKRKN